MESFNLKLLIWLVLAHTTHESAFQKLGTITNTSNSSRPKYVVMNKYHKWGCFVKIKITQQKPPNEEILRVTFKARSSAVGTV